MIRLSGGRFKGQGLVVPEGRATRPTSSMLRETLFNILQNGMGLQPHRVLDLFAGSGALGFEALSRGASKVAFFEKAGPALACLAENVTRLGLSQEEALVVAKAKFSEWPNALLSRDAFVPVDLVLCDPPYEKGLAAKALESLEQGSEGLFEEDCVLVLEVSAKEEPPELSAWEGFKERGHGAGKLCFYERRLA